MLPPITKLPHFFDIENTHKKQVKSSLLRNIVQDKLELEKDTDTFLHKFDIEPESAVEATEAVEAAEAEPEPSTFPLVEIVVDPSIASPDYTLNRHFVKKKTKHLGRSQYHAVETHGYYGFIDTGLVDDHGYRQLQVHLPRNSSGLLSDLEPGLSLSINSCFDTKIRTSISVGYIAPLKYVRPGNKCTSCLMGVPDEDWNNFMLRHI